MSTTIINNHKSIESFTVDTGRESIVGSVADKSLMDSPTSSITEHSASGVVNVLKIAQDWQQKQQQKQQQQQQQQHEDEEETSHDSLPLEESRLTTTQKKDPSSRSLKEMTTTSALPASESLPLILEPKDLRQQDILSSVQIEELFVEMCFYARLGFLQPPCCLLCTYEESAREGRRQQESRTNSNSGCCQRWVIWRRNAKLPLHPNHLEENILLTQCHVAQALLQGKKIEGYAWDSAHKELIYGV